MPEPYNQFSGQSIERLTALSDGLFAVAMTLLVLDLRVPLSTAGSVATDSGLWGALLRLGPSFAAYLPSFTMLGTFWLAQHTLLNILGGCDRTLTWINLGFLFVVSLLPFSAALLAHYVHLRLAVGVYWLNLLLLGAGLEWGARYGRTALVPGDAQQARSRLATFRRRDPARAEPVRAGGAAVPAECPGKRDRAGGRAALLHRLAPPGPHQGHAARRPRQRATTSPLKRRAARGERGVLRTSTGSTRVWCPVAR